MIKQAVLCFMTASISARVVRPSLLSSDDEVTLTKRAEALTDIDKTTNASRATLDVGTVNHTDDINIVWHARRDPIITCGDSTQHGQTTNTSPTLQDCQSVLSGLANNPGYWSIDHWGSTWQWAILMSYQSCSIAVRRVDQDAAADIGNADVQYLVQTSLNKYASQGRVAASGTLDCTSEHNPQINWLLGPTGQ